jgi:hypothetical protein
MVFTAMLLVDCVSVAAVKFLSAAHTALMVQVPEADVILMVAVALAGVPLTGPAEHAPLALIAGKTLELVVAVTVKLNPLAALAGAPVKVTVGATLDGVTVKAPARVTDWPSGFVIVTLTGPGVSAGTTTLMLIAELTATEVASVEPKRTVAAGWKFCPAITTVSPPAAGPEFGVTPVIVGGGARTFTVTESFTVMVSASTTSGNAGVSVTVMASLIVGMVTDADGGSRGAVVVPAPLSEIDCVYVGGVPELGGLLKAALSEKTMVPVSEVGVPEGT